MFFNLLESLNNEMLQKNYYSLGKAYVLMCPRA